MMTDIDVLDDIFGNDPEFEKLVKEAENELDKSIERQRLEREVVEAAKRNSIADNVWQDRRCKETAHASRDAEQALSTAVEALLAFEKAQEGGER